MSLTTTETLGFADGVIEFLTNSGAPGVSSGPFSRAGNLLGGETWRYNKRVAGTDCDPAIVFAEREFKRCQPTFWRNRKTYVRASCFCSIALTLWRNGWRPKCALDCRCPALPLGFPT